MKRRTFLAGIAALGVGAKLGSLSAPTAAAVTPAAPVTPATAIIAAGGWCAPTEAVYDLAGRVHGFSYGVIDLADLPEIKMNRGAIKFVEEL